MVLYDVIASERGNYSIVVVHDPDAVTQELAEGVCIAVFAGADSLGRASRYAAEKQREAEMET